MKTITYDNNGIFYNIIKSKPNTKNMLAPVECQHCGHIYDSASVKVINRYADCSEWICPKCANSVKPEKYSLMKTPDLIQAKPYIGFNQVFAEHLFNNSEKATHINELDRTVLKQMRFDLIYLRMAYEWSKNSYCKRKQVGSIIVNNHKIISDGYNGMPNGFNNCCEDEHDGETKWNVLHAEANALMKLTYSADSAYGSTVYITFSPCKDCSKLMYQAGIKRIVFTNTHSNTEGLYFLNKAGIEIWRYPEPLFNDFDKLNEIISSK